MSSDFNWVTARAECSLGVLFRKIRIEAGRNVDAINEIAKKSESHLRFELSPHGDRFAVIRDHGSGTTGVEFILSQAKISVKTDAGKSFDAIPALNPDGERKLLVGEESLEIWQFCRLALDDLFFSV